MRVQTIPRLGNELGGWGDPSPVTMIGKAFKTARLKPQYDSVYKKMELDWYTVAARTGINTPARRIEMRKVAGSWPLYLGEHQSAAVYVDAAMEAHRHGNFKAFDVDSEFRFTPEKILKAYAEAGKDLVRGTGSVVKVIVNEAAETAAGGAKKLGIDLGELVNKLALYGGIGLAAYLLLPRLLGTYMSNRKK